MPAIQPVKLKSQVMQLAERFTQPAAFVRGLTELLDQYADHTHRSGLSGEPAPLVTTFNTPTPVMRQVGVMIKPLAGLDPPLTLELCDQLWAQPYLEHRLLAADLLGLLPLEYKSQVIARVENWTRIGTDERLIDAVLLHGLAHLRSQAPYEFTDLVQNWLSNPDTMIRQLGLRYLQSLAADPQFTNLPMIFRLLSPFLRDAPAALRPDILNILSLLIHRTPREAAYLLQQNLTTSDSVDTAWLIRQVSAEFPDELQANLREASRASRPPSA